MEKMEKDMGNNKDRIIQLQSMENIVNIGKITLICGQLKIKENVEKQN